MSEKERNIFVQEDAKLIGSVAKESGVPIKTFVTMKAWLAQVNRTNGRRIAIALRDKSRFRVIDLIAAFPLIIFCLQLLQ